MISEDLGIKILDYLKEEIPSLRGEIHEIKEKHLERIDMRLSKLETYTKEIRANLRLIQTDSLPIMKNDINTLKVGQGVLVNLFKGLEKGQNKIEDKVEVGFAKILNKLFKS